MGTVCGKAALALLGLYAGASSCAARADELGETLHTLRGLNRHSSLEPAGARGSIGIGAGAGAMQVEAGATPAYREALGLDESDARETALVPRLWLTKGLWVPVDLGFAASQIRQRGGGRATQVAGQLQWTVYEDFAMPAFGVRASHARLFGLERAEMRSDALEAVASYGFLRYFTVFGSIGVARHETALAAGAGSELALLLAPGEERRVFAESWTEPVRAAGLKVTVWPPFVTLCSEAAIAGGRTETFAAKISVGM